jgi:hypothetical protein
MGFGDRCGATPAVESVSYRSMLVNFLEVAPIKVAHINLKPNALLRFSSTEFLESFLRNFLPLNI